MKKIYSLAFILLSTVFLTNAQSLSIVFQDTLVVGNAKINTELVAYAHVKNNSTQSIDVIAKRIDENYNTLTDSNAICWAGGCYITSVSQSPFALTLAAGATATDFSAHIYPDGDGVAVNGPIRYVFFDQNNPSDSVSFIMKYSVIPNIGLAEKVLPTISVYPNPASTFLKVQLKNLNGSDAQFDLVDMVGNKVFSKKIVGQQKEFELDLSNVARGIYFYALKQNNVTIATKKLVVR